MLNKGRIVEEGVPRDPRGLDIEKVLDGATISEASTPETPT
ncbi:hypothetical protein [Ferrimicrobium sp.]|nr:hypothetical protein [Ferrimicrobium sp.]